jgi:hypothetical protein
MKSTVRRPVAWLAWLLGLAACGGSAPAAGFGHDGGPDGGRVVDLPDATVEDAMGRPPIDASKECPVQDGAAVDGDAGCIEGGTPPGLGSAFACGQETCFTRSQYCFFESAGQARIPGPGGAFDYGSCVPFPCSCGATPSCDCLRSVVKGPCACVEQCGATGVSCVYP